MKKYEQRITAFILIVLLVLSLYACAKSSAQDFGVQGGDFAEHNELTTSLTTSGNTTVTLTSDETTDITGIELDGRKEIILNNYTLTLKGKYSVSQNAVLDIKPGEGFTKGAIDMSGLTFDLSSLPVEVPPELPLVEIRPGITIIEPQYTEGVNLREFPGMLTVIQYN